MRGGVRGKDMHVAKNTSPPREFFIYCIDTEIKLCACYCFTDTCSFTVISVSQEEALLRRHE